MSRFDNRTVSTFKKDISFGTQMETFLFQEWLKSCQKKGYEVHEWDHNGVDNNGEFVESGNTSGADYWVTMDYGPLSFEEEPLEVKWVPTAGKFSLKVGDLKAYIREKASILFIYNTCHYTKNLRKPRDYNFDKHVRLIESKMDRICWGIMDSDNVERMYQTLSEKGRVVPIPYMGNKPGIILESWEFSDWFNEETLL